MTKHLLLFPLILSLLFLSGVGCKKEAAKTEEGIQPRKEIKRTVATFETNLGTFKIRFFDQDAPQTVQNFVKLAKSGFYDGIKFHRVIKDFMLQTGDPNSRLDDWSLHGRGGPGYAFDDEINQHKLIRGMVAMANSGPNSNGSQFFIVTAKAASWLDGKHTVFGEVVYGMEVIDKIENVKVNKNDHPVEDVVMEKVIVGD